jgi:hypothetical protein
MVSFQPATSNNQQQPATTSNQQASSKQVANTPQAIPFSSKPSFKANICVSHAMAKLSVPVSVLVPSSLIASASVFTKSSCMPCKPISHASQSQTQVSHKQVKLCRASQPATNSVVIQRCHASQSATNSSVMQRCHTRQSATNSSVMVVRIKCAFFGVRICIVYAFYKLDMHFIN